MTDAPNPRATSVAVAARETVELGSAPDALPSPWRDRHSEAARYGFDASLPADSREEAPGA